MASRPGSFVETMTAYRWPERCALLFGLFTGILAIGLALTRLQTGPELDYHAYYFAGEFVLRGDPFVGRAIHDGTFLTVKEYVYTPITAPIFVIYGIFPTWHAGYVLNVALLLLVFYLLARLMIRFVERHGGTVHRLDEVLIVGFCLFSGHSILGLYRGNIDPMILLMLAVGLVAIEGGDEVRGGALWAIAAVFKLFPALLGIWLLYRRKYQAVAAALLTGFGSLLISLLVFGVDAHLRWAEFLIYERSREGAFEGGVDPTLLWITLRRPLSQLVSFTGIELMVLSATLMVPIVYVVYRDAETELDRVVAYFATMLVLLITVVPSTLNYVVYVFFPLIPLLYLTDDAATRKLFVAGLLLVHLPVYPQHVRMLVDAASFTGGIGDLVLAVSETLLTYSSIPLVGFVLLIIGCVRFVRIPASTPIE